VRERGLRGELRLEYLERPVHEPPRRRELIGLGDLSRLEAPDGKGGDRVVGGLGSADGPW
jgi:hypothetical protein